MFVTFAPGENAALHLSKLAVSDLTEMAVGTRFAKTLEYVGCDNGCASLLWAQSPNRVDLGTCGMRLAVPESCPKRCQLIHPLSSHASCGWSNSGSKFEEWAGT